MKSDDELGMGAAITRRDLLHDASATALGLILGTGAKASLAYTNPAAAEAADAPADSPVDSPRDYPAAYPPTKTGLRGSHPGAFEAAHAPAREGKSFPEPRDLDEDYDLVIVGAGISGLAAAHYYRQRFGDDARILLLENHDDFGGHAKRNEFHQGGQMRLSLGGTHNLEWWNFSDTVNAFLAEHGVDPQAMLKQRQFNYGRTARNGSAIWFDKAYYGVDRLVTGCDLKVPGGPPAEAIDQMPISANAREQLKTFYQRRENVLPDLDQDAAEDYLRSISYPEFLRRYGGLDAEAVQLFDKQAHGSWGVEIRALSAMEGMEADFPGHHLIGRADEHEPPGTRSALWPDGNASLARLQVATLIPEVAPGANADNIALARFDYAALDRSDAAVRLRLNSTVVNVDDRDDKVAVSYYQNGEVLRLRAKHCVMACYHSVIPHICPELPAAQQDALRYQVKLPLLLSNVLIRNTKALDKLGIDRVICPGRMHQNLFTFRGINTGGYEHDIADDGPVSLVFWGSISPPAEVRDVKDQARASRAIMLGLSFEDYEREIREVLDGLLGPAGFDVASDVLAITVNRWPHGYAYEYLDLWDDDWPQGEAPHEIARRTFGRIGIANADAGASAYTHTAIDQAYRAVAELPG
jgi:spermidine dehydrogenase